MSTTMDKEAMREAYDDVRNDNTETNWAIFKYEGNAIEVSGTGVDYAEFQTTFGDDDRGFGFVRVTSGDEMSKRAKFVLITWLGQNVSAFKSAKVGTDKPLVRQVIQSVSVEIQTSEHCEIEENYVLEEVRKAGGANYGTGAH